MNIIVEGTDPYGNEAYHELFRRILIDLGKNRVVEEVRIVQRPADPVFVYSLRLRTRPERRVLSDVATLRDEPEGARLTISDEVFAPAILSILWERYRRDRVDQLSRYEISVQGVSVEEIEDIEVSSGDKVKNEIIDAMWRTLPEGMKARYNLTEGNVLTILATEDKMTEELKEEARAMHRAMGGEVNV